MAQSPVSRRRGQNEAIHAPLASAETYWLKRLVTAKCRSASGEMDLFSTQVGKVGSPSEKEVRKASDKPSDNGSGYHRPADDSSGRHAADNLQ